MPVDESTKRMTLSKALLNRCLEVVPSSGLSGQYHPGSLEEQSQSDCETYQKKLVVIAEVEGLKDGRHCCSLKSHATALGGLSNKLLREAHEFVLVLFRSNEPLAPNKGVFQYPISCCFCQSKRIYEIKHLHLEAGDNWIGRPNVCGLLDLEWNLIEYGSRWSKWNWDTPS
jgi:hypothetical protein